MGQDYSNRRYYYRCSVLAAILFLPPFFANAQSGTDTTGTGGRHTISGRLVFPSGQRADLQLKVRLESTGQGDLTVLSDINGSFSFRSLRAGNYTVVIEGGDFFENVRESVFIEPYNVAPRRIPGSVPVSRPINLQIYLRPKQETSQVKPGVLNAVLASVPKSAVELYEKGLESASRGESETAIEEFTRAIGLYPKFGLALNQLGIQYLKRGELDKAERSLRSAVELLPEDHEPHLNYGIVLLNRKKFSEAEAQLRLALKLNEPMYTGHLYLGIALIYVKNYLEAETALKRAIELGNSKASKAHYYLGGLYWQTGKLRQAADELEQFLKLEPKAANAERLRSTISELRKQPTNN